MKKLVAIGLLAALGGCAAWNTPKPPPSTPVFFKPQSAALDQSALTTIEIVAKAASAQPDKPVIIVGTTENKADVTSNQAKALSNARAQAVAAQLVADGVSKDRLHIYGAGAVDAPKGLNAAQGARRVLISIGN